MLSKLSKLLEAAKSDIMAGNPAEAVSKIEQFLKLLEVTAVPAEERDGLEAKIAELRQLAEAAQLGTQSAISRIREIVETARSLQTYDSSGNLHVARTIINATHRY